MQNTAKRYTMILGSEMVTFKINLEGGIEVLIDNVSEASEFYRQIMEKASTGQTPWNALRFSTFIDSLGGAQLSVLKFLLKNQKVDVDFLKLVAGVESNQQLAGILSGISKQAAARDVPARAVFRIDNEYTSGKAQKYYTVAPEFMKIAAECNWPEVEADPEPVANDGAKVEAPTAPAQPRQKLKF